jgi:hypothetical protein
MAKSRTRSKLLTEVQKEEISQPSNTITQVKEKNNQELSTKSNVLDAMA